MYVHCYVEEPHQPQSKRVNTDTHFRAAGGTAAWNYRLKFDVTLTPTSRNQRIHLEVWDRDMVPGMDDPAGEAVLSLSKWFKAAFEERTPRRQYWDTTFFNLKRNARHYFTNFSEALENLSNDKAGGVSASRAAEDDAEAVEKAKLWVPLYNATIDEKGQFFQRGKLLVSIQLVPEEDKEKLPAGWGRSEPNSNPFLPKPPGRLQFTLNPISLSRQFLGPKLCRKLLRFICYILSLYILFHVLPVIFGTVFMLPLHLSD